VAAGACAVVSEIEPRAMLAEVAFEAARQIDETNALL
jgi:hypothetical protein